PVLRRGALAVMMSLALSGVTHAQQVPSGIPNTGLLLQQTPQQPATVPPSDLDLRMLHFRKQPVSDTHAFMVKRIRIVGNTLLSDERLRSLVIGYEGKELTLGNLED